MTAETKRTACKIAVILCLMAVSYAAGTASASDAQTLSRLNLADASIVKAQALLAAASPTTRPGVVAIAAAKQSLGKALEQTKQAEKAVGRLRDSMISISFSRVRISSLN